MKKLLRFLCLICVAIISVFAVACNVNQTGGSTDGLVTGGGSNSDSGTSSDSGFITAGSSTSGSSQDAAATTTAIETEIAESITYDFSALSENLAIPTDATVIDGSEETYEIKAAGSYVLSGTFSAGVTVKKNAGTVHIYLNNATIVNDSANESEEDNALAIKTGNTVTITVVNGTTNAITSNEKNALNSNGDVYINGSGTLNVTGTAKNGIKVDSALIIVDATVNVTSVNHAISAYNVNAKDCTINVITSNDGEAKDGIHAEMDDSVTAWTKDDGYVIMNNVNYTANVEGDGIQADTFVYIDGGTYAITTTAKFVSYTSENLTKYGLTADDFRYRYSNGAYYKQASDEIKSLTSSNYYAMIQSSKGIKVGEIDYDTEDANGNAVTNTITNGNYYLIIEGGTFTVNSADDALHVNSGSLTINGGTITLNTLDDGITSDNLTKIQGGTVTVNYCYEGIEGSYVEINGGTIRLNYCQDDGINAASDYNVSEYIKIAGGDIYVNAYGDGLDSNGTITISGGKVFVDGPSDNGNGSIDTEDGFYMNGGYVVAVGSSNWINEATPKSSSSQYSLVYAGNTIAAGTTLTLKDGSGNTVISFKTGKSSSSVVISAPEITAGTYTLYSGNSELATFNVTSKVTTVGTSAGGGGSFTPGGGVPSGNGGGTGGKPSGGNRP